MSVLDFYITASALTGRMLDAAREQNWDELISVGTDRDRLLESLPVAILPMSPQDSEQVARLIKEILACHTEISERAGPWLEHTATLLAAFDQRSSTTVSTIQISPTETR
ncbi:MAG: flagellar protein FliT [Propionivibrio sp.]|uniref:flagellar protein FliT n=1 Tax=Propionivibrio sp. TaxID=2212460 RepID=UPI001A5361AB|nr:flagellar protein FliT [Propionivibrio sp.]MBL8416355.1 flagellar protein FliT [Propionivibrio sp.]